MNKRRILVVGDWVVDDYWVAADLRSPTASRTGSLPLQSLHDLESTVQALVGAGRVASLLHNAQCDSIAFEIVGLGIWHADDTEYLRAMFKRELLRGLNPYRLTPHLPLITDADAPRLVNLGKYLKATDQQVPPAPFGTNRVIRGFQRAGDRMHLLGRLDWELSPEGRARTGQHEWGFDPASSTELTEDGKAGQTLAQRLLKDGDHFDAIVIKDLCKGVVSHSLLAYLHQNCSKDSAKWFVSTKACDPDWKKLFVSALENTSLPKLALYLVTPVAAEGIVRESHSPSPQVHSWFSSARKGSRETPEALEFLEAFLPSQPKCVITHITDDYRLLARGPVDPHSPPTLPTVAWGGRQGLIRDRIAHAPMASIFFSHVVAAVLQNDPNPTDSKMWRDMMQDGLFYARAFAEQETGWLKSPHETLSRPEMPITIGTDGRRTGQYLPQNPPPPVQLFEWRKARHHWDIALGREQGIMTGIPDRILSGRSSSGEEDVIELFRSQCELDGFVCCEKTKRRVLANWVNELQAFAAERHPGRHISGLIEAAPGVGKSTLVESLRRSVPLEYEDVNIAQLTTRDQLIDFFDRICSIQIKQRGRPVFIFVDEINASLQERPAYGMFLTVLQDGVYLRGSNKVTLSPCIWIFAGTANRKDISVVDKGSDFVDRLVLEDLALGEVSELERVYLGVAMIRGQFKEVDRISRSVLNEFRRKATARELRRLVSSLKSVTQGQISGRNLPGAEDPGNAARWVTISDGPFLEEKLP